MNKIKSIQIQNLHNNGKLYEVGKNGVYRIKDCSLEYESSIWSMFEVKNKSGHLIASIENCPILTEYDVPENEKPKQLELSPDPTEKPEKFNFKKSLIELGGSEQIVKDYLKHRTKKRLSDTETAFNTLKNQLVLAGKKKHTVDKCLETIIDSGWQKFKAGWMDNINEMGSGEKDGGTVDEW